LQARISLQGKGHPTPAGKGRPAVPGTLGLPVGSPINKEDNMAGFFLYHRLKRLDQLTGQKPRLPGQAKEAKGKEGIKALGIAQPQERPFGGGNGLGDWGFLPTNVVVLQHRFKDALVARFFEALEGKRFTQQGVTFHVCQGSNARSGLPFGSHGNIPEREAAEAGKCVVIKTGPGNSGWIIWIMRGQKRLAKKHLMGCGPNCDGSWSNFLRVHWCHVNWIPDTD
jgi:hypothetical protein